MNEVDPDGLGVWDFGKAIANASRTAEIVQRLYKEQDKAYTNQDFEKAAIIDTAIRDLQAKGFNELADAILNVPIATSWQELAIGEIIDLIMDYYMNEQKNNTCPLR